MKAGKQRRIVYAPVMAALLVFCAVMALLPDSAHAIRVTMKRIIFEGPARSDVITIINNSAKEETYRLGWRHFKMTPDQMLANVEEGAEEEYQKMVEKIVRYAPRRITLPPGQKQQVRLVARRPRDLPEGEYRAHLWIIPETRPPEFTPEERGQARQQGAAIKIGVSTGVSIPVFVRQGNLTADASITDGRLVRQPDEMKLTYKLNRTGNRSLYGDMDYTCFGAGGEYVVWQTRGVAVYTDVTHRNMDVRIPYPEGGPDACPKVRITYRAEADDRLFKGDVMAEAVVSR